MVGHLPNVGHVLGTFHPSHRIGAALHSGWTLYPPGAGWEMPPEGSLGLMGVAGNVATLGAIEVYKVVEDDHVFEVIFDFLQGAYGLLISG